MVSSKSGGTSETMSALKYFWKEIEKLGVGNIGSHFVAVTTPTHAAGISHGKGFEDASMLQQTLAAVILYLHNLD